jgi:hypothetical protein
VIGCEATRRCGERIGHVSDGLAECRDTPLYGHLVHHLEVDTDLRAPAANGVRRRCPRRYIFLDADPDPVRSFRERRGLVELRPAASS